MVDESLPVAIIDGATYAADLVNAQAVSDPDFTVDSDSQVDLTVDELKDVLGGLHRGVSVFCDARKSPCGQTAEGFLVAISGGTGMLIDTLVQGACALEGMTRVESVMDSFCDNSADAGEAALGSIASGGLWASVTSITLRKLYTSSCKQFPAGERLSSLAKGKGLGLEEALAGRRLQGWWGDRWNDLKDGAAAVADAGKALVDGVEKVGAYIKEEGGEIIQDVKEVGGEIIEEVKQTEIGAAVVDGVTYVAGGLKDHVQAYISNFKQCAEQIGNAIG